MRQVLADVIPFHRERLRVRRWCLVVLIVVALPVWLCNANARAQATGAVTGVITDPQGRVVAGATVELTNAATKQLRSTVSASSGEYQFPLVAPGNYTLQVTAPGFRSLVASGVQVLVNGTSREDARLLLGSTTDAISVTGSAPLVETSNATTGVVVGQQDVADLPLNGRNFAQLGTLIPGVVAAPAGLGGASGNATPGGFGDTTGSFNVNGQRNQSNSFLLDGAQNNDSFNSGFVMRPPPDAIQEFKIMTHSYEAQYGRNAGSVVNVVTRSGTDQYHGSVWDFNREGALAARNFFTPAASAKPEYLQNQFGAAGGGRILRDRWFFFGYYEGYRVKDATANTLSVPELSSAERAGNFSELLTGAAASSGCAATGVSGSGRIIDPATGAQYCYGGQPNVIDPARESAISSYLLQNYIHLPNAANNFYVEYPPNIDNRDMYGIRSDYKWRSHQLLGRYLYAHQNLFGPLTPSSFPVTGNRQIMSLYDALGSDTWILNAHMINVARYARQWIHGVPNRTSGVSPSTAGYQYQPTNQQALGLPNVTLTGYFTQGDLQQPFASRKNYVDSIDDDFTWVKGRHQFQFGGEVQRDAIDLLFINRPNGAFTFNGNFTGNTLADFFLGYPYMFQQGSGDPALNGASWTYAAYAQDEFRVNRHLTLDVGLRYEVNLPYTEANNHLAALHPGQQSTVQPTAPLGLVYPGDRDTPRATYYADTNNVAPRLGINFDPTGDAKTTLRAAWGVFYDTVPGQGDFFQNGTLAPPFQPLQEIDFYPRPLASASSAYFANPYAGVTSGPAGFPSGLTFIGWSLPHSFQTARVYQYNVGIQHQVADVVGVEVAYVGSRGAHLPVFIEANPTTVVAASSGTSAYTAGSRAVFPALGLVRPTFSAGGSWYDSLQTSLQLRSWHHVRATAAYTWSHSIDDLSGLNIGGDSRPVLPVTIGDQSSIDAAMSEERGNSLFDARQRVVVSFSYELPQMRSSNAVEKLLLGGWQINGIFQAQSGNPFTAVSGTTTAQSLTFRPNLTCNANNGPRRVGSASIFLNVGCLQLPMTSGGLINNSQSGNEPRNVLLGPRWNSSDASLFKIVPVASEQNVEFRFEVFDLFNEAHFAQPNATFGASNFGTITSTVGSDQRIIQMALKYSF
ncbi:TonB-dependent Receptor Plug Domain [Bryocella elongata]|uniref:TonB-dependent Receptor Plug Domain n=1 Tax=Bryocella elongata TaxID=863522 RepID=A0A1H5U666_9BACT|nr:carboxypeptidase regulatory-like domain-containing protein [Bryocella elongata]SEF70526.1 TonB-dependent Receptor Plug Domain [Bryocella elongata]